MRFRAGREALLAVRAGEGEGTTLDYKEMLITSKIICSRIKSGLEVNHKLSDRLERTVSFFLIFHFALMHQCSVMQTSGPMIHVPVESGGER